MQDTVADKPGLLDRARRAQDAKPKPGPKCSVCKVLDAMDAERRREWTDLLDSPYEHDVVYGIFVEERLDVTKSGVAYHRGKKCVTHDRF